MTLSAVNHAILEEVLQQRIDPSQPCTIPPEWLNAVMNECIHRGMLKANQGQQPTVIRQDDRPRVSSYSSGDYGSGLAVGMAIGSMFDVSC